MTTIKQIIFFLVLFINSMGLVATEKVQAWPTLNVDKITESQKLYPYYKIYSSEENKTPDDVLKALLIPSKPFRPFKSIPSFGYSTKSYWFLIKLNNFSKPIHLVMHQARAEQFEVFLFDQKNLRKTSTYKTDFNRFKRNDNSILPSFLIKPSKAKQSYLLVKLASKVAHLNGFIELKTTKSWQGLQLKSNIFGGIIYGTLFAIFLYTIFLSIFLRRASFFYYSLYLVSLLISHSAAIGHLYFLEFLPEYSNKYSVYLFAIAANVFLFLFSREYLEIRWRSLHGRIIQFILLLMIIIFLALIVTSLISVTLMLKAISAILIGINLSLLYALALGFIYYLKGQRRAIYFLIAMPWLLTGVSIRIFLVGGLLSESFFTINAIYIGSTIEAVLLSIGVVAYFNELELKSKFQEKAAQNTSNFLSRMSHELRTPLNSILGMTTMLKEESKANPSYIKTLNNSSELLLALVNDVLDVSKIEAGEMKLEKVAFNLESLSESSINIFLPAAKSKDLKYEFKFYSNCGNLVASDPTRIRQIMVNLLSNALKFTTKGYIKIGVSLTLTEVKKDSKKGIVMITVKDTGVGISPDKKDEILLPFKQTNENTTREYGGTGLGLSIVKSIVELLNGSLMIYSKPDKGSNFVVQFELDILDNLPDSSKFSDINIENIKTRKLNVLLAEDNEDNILLFKAFTKDLNLNLSIARNGKEAVEITKQAKFDLILMDIQMPILDGLQATKIIRKWEKHSHNQRTLIYAITAHVTKEEVDNCINAGCDGHLGKPIRKDDLLNLINQVSQIQV